MGIPRKEIRALLEPNVRLKHLQVCFRVAGIGVGADSRSMSRQKRVRRTW